MTQTNLWLDDNDLEDMIAITTYQKASNFPIFYDTTAITGFSNSGTYYCYKREQNYSRFDLHSGAGNPGVVAEVS